MLFHVADFDSILGATRSHLLSFNSYHYRFSVGANAVKERVAVDVGTYFGVFWDAGSYPKASSTCGGIRTGSQVFNSTSIDSEASIHHHSEKKLDAELLKEQWALIRKASELGNLEDTKEVKEKFIQRFHWQHSAVKGLLRFMDDLQHYQVHNPDASVEKADSDVSSEHFEDPNMGALIQLMTSEKK